MPAKRTEYITLASVAHQVSELHVEGCIDADSIVATAPPGDHRAIVSNVVPMETLKALDGYIADHRVGCIDEDDPLFTDRQGRALKGNAIPSCSSVSR
jgi:hypothetical protein